VLSVNQFVNVQNNYGFITPLPLSRFFHNLEFYAVFSPVLLSIAIYHQPWRSIIDQMNGRSCKGNKEKKRTKNQIHHHVVHVDDINVFVWLCETRYFAYFARASTFDPKFDPDASALSLSNKKRC